jgi:hypothetical protein
LQLQIQVRGAVEAFKHKDWRFEDFYEADLTVYTYRFRFCCYALAWAVQRYDAMKGT